MDIAKDVRAGKRQTKLEFVLSWVAAIAIVVVGGRLGGGVGFLVALPLGLGTGLAANAIFSKAWTFRTKAAAILLLYAAIAVLFWLAFWLALPAIHHALGFG